jgi:thioesterase domain-containing protein
VFFYHALAKQLGPDQPFYGLQSVGLQDDRAPLTRVEDMAAHYIAEMREVQPEGPYLLGGYCMGSYVALEMACQLQEQGQKVAMLAIFETDGAWRKIKSFGQELGYHRGRLSKQSTRNKLAYLVNRIGFRIRRAKSIPKRRLIELAARLQGKVPKRLRIFYINELNIRANRNYVPHRYNGTITYFQAKDGFRQDPNYFWRDVADGLELHNVPGAAIEMFREPHVQALARALTAALEKAQTHADSPDYVDEESRALRDRLSLPDATITV